MGGKQINVLFQSIYESGILKAASSLTRYFQVKLLQVSHNMPQQLLVPEAGISIEQSNYWTTLYF